jgi:hypothetical protein
MKQDYEGQGLTWFFRIVFALAAVSLLAFMVGLIALVGGFVRGVWSWLN